MTKTGKRKTRSKSDYLVHGEFAIAEAERYIRQMNRELTRVSSKEERLDALYLERMECEEALRRLTQGKQHYFEVGSKSADPIDHIWYWEKVREAVSDRFSKEKSG